MSVPNYPMIAVGTAFLRQLVICLPLVVNNNIYLSHIVDNFIFGINVPDYPNIAVETTFLQKNIICLLLVVNNNKN